MRQCEIVLPHVFAQSTRVNSPMGYHASHGPCTLCMRMLSGCYRRTRWIGTFHTYIAVAVNSLAYAPPILRTGHSNIITSELSGIACFKRVGDNNRGRAE